MKKINIESDTALAEKICRRFEQLKQERLNWENHWQELSDYFIPEKDDVYGFRMDGERKHNTLYDSTSIHSLEMLASSLHGMLTNPSSTWFGLSTGDSRIDEDPDVQEYLQTCTRIMIDIMNASNFQEEIHETYVDLGGIGTTVLDIEEDDETDVRFFSHPIFQNYISENVKGVVDTLYREINYWTRRNLVEKFGEDVMFSIDGFRDLYNQNPDVKECVIFAIMPHQVKKGKYEAHYVYHKSRKILKTNTFHSWPHAVPRWTKLNQEVYGRAPAMKCLPDVKMANAMMKTLIRGMQKAVDPPIMVPDNGFLLPLNMTPNGTNFYRAGSKDRIEVLQTGARPDIGLDFVENVRARIREAFFWDQMQLINQRDMTATEVMQRTDERLRFLGPILGRLNNELLRPIIDRVFDILNRRGKFPAPPEALAGKRSLKIVYTSQIAKAQRTSEANTLIKVLQTMEPIFQFDPQIVDNFNGDAILRYQANQFGLPHEFLRKPKEVKETREQRAKAQAEAARAQQENMNADTAQKAAKAQQTQQQAPA